MKYLDFTIQSLIMLVAFAVALACITTKPEVFIMMLTVQFYLGCWQITSSVISLIARAPHFRTKSIYLTIVVIYLLSFFGIFNSGFDIPHLAAKLYCTVPAWALAIYYYVITWQWTFPKRTSGGKFLPHINF